MTIEQFLSLHPVVQVILILSIVFVILGFFIFTLFCLGFEIEWHRPRIDDRKK